MTDRYTARMPSGATRRLLTTADYHSMIETGRQSFYADRHPRPHEVLLLIEVAATSYEFDRDLKLPLYAEAGVREVWLIALDHRVVEVHRDPGGRSYRQTQRLRAGDTVAPIAFPDLEADVAYLLG